MTLKQLVHTFFLTLLLPINVYASFDKLVVFGDSLSDTGNLASAISGFPSTPFYEGSRLTDGPVAVEHLASLLGLTANPSLHFSGDVYGSNFSVAGASARTVDSRPLDLEAQVGAHLLKNAGAATENTLYIIFIGGNDIRDARGLPQAEARKILNEAVDTIDEQLRLLISVGAKSIMVVNAPDIGALPETFQIADSTGKSNLIKQTRRRSKYFNRLLDSKVDAIECDTHLDLILFDLFAFMKNLTSNAQAFGYTNTSHACYSSARLQFNAECELGDRFPDYLFFDEVHPTGRSHERLSRALYAVVPE